MCGDCYDEMGAPVLITDQVKRAAALMSRIKEIDFWRENISFLTDWNIDDADIESCINVLSQTKHPTMLTELEMECCSLFLGMTMQERASTLAIDSGLIGAVYAH